MRTPPRQAHLDDLWTRTHRITLYEGGASGGVPLTDVRLLTIEPPALEELTQLLAIEDAAGGICMCLGDYTFEVADAQDEVIAVLVLHHRRSLYAGRWTDHAVLRQPSELVDWLAARGVPKLAAEEEAARQRAEDSARDRAAWAAAAPPVVGDMIAGLGPEWFQAVSYPESDIDEIRQSLDAAYPGPDERIAATLRWYGAGTGRTSGFPTYEDVPGQVLLRERTADVIAVVEGTRDHAVLLGALRLWAGWNFRQRRDELTGLAPETRQGLINLARTTGDADRLSRAEGIFGRR